MSLEYDYYDTAGTWNSTEYPSSSSETDDMQLNDDNSTSVVNATNTTYMYCGPLWNQIGTAYSNNVHGYMSLVVCIFGCLANLLNLIVLTRKSMINPTNAILTGLALSDFGLMFEYIPYVSYMYIWKGVDKARTTYGWALFVLLHSNFSQICHTISIQLTVLLAIWRYIMVSMPMKNKTLCTMIRAKWAIVSSYLFPLLLCTPLYLTFSISERKSKISSPETNNTRYVYVVYYSDLAKAHDSLLVKINFWIYSVLIKIFPCIILTVVSWRLIHSLMEAKKRKQQLLSNKNPRSKNENTNETSSDRTTRMLLAVLLLFLITEAPQGILAAISGVLGVPFFKSCYLPLADLADFIALLNSSINFILYCAMSKKFREVFSNTFHLSVICRFTSSVSAEPSQSASRT